jgi:hypothetical protein
MGFFRELSKIGAALIGLPLTLGGVGGFVYGVYLLLARRNSGSGILLIIASIVALTIGTILGKYARGDYD